MCGLETLAATLTRESINIFLRIIEISGISLGIKSVSLAILSSGELSISSYQTFNKSINSSRSRLSTSLGQIDLPAMIDFVLLNTGQKDLHYIGHSQGTTSFFVMASLRTEMNAKIRTMHAFGELRTNI